MLIELIFRSGRKYLIENVTHVTEHNGEITLHYKNKGKETYPKDVIREINKL